MAAVRRLVVGLLALSAAGLLSGCGKKGPLIPPEALAPAPISDLGVVQKGERFEVSWSVPSRQEGGGRLTDLAGFLLFRRPVLPPDQDCEECPTAYQQLSRIDLDYLQGVRSVGGRMVYDDTDLTRGKTYQYKVRSVNEDGVESKDSNKARRTAVTPPPPPALEAAESATGVVLTIAAPRPAEGSVTGYNVYRTTMGGPMPPSPFKTIPPTTATYEDNEVLIGSSYSYWVTTVAKVGAETVESLPSNIANGAMSSRD